MKSLTKTLLLIGICTASACNKDNSEDPVSNAQDKSFVQMASYSNIAEVEAGKLATEKTTGAPSWFGMMMHMDHQTAQSELGGIATAQRLVTPIESDSMHKKQKEYLMGLSGHTFDSAYLHSQVIDHINTIVLFQQEIDNGQNESVRAYAIKYLPKIRMHKQMVDSLVKEL